MFRWLAPDHTIPKEHGNRCSITAVAGERDNETCSTSELRATSAPSIGWRNLFAGQMERDESILNTSQLSGFDLRHLQTKQEQMLARASEKIKSVKVSCLGGGQEWSYLTIAIPYLIRGKKITM